MTDRSRLPEVPPTALRDHADDERLERVWDRLEGSLPRAGARSRAALWWLPAAAVLLFGAGVGLGMRLARAPALPSPLLAEPRPAGDPAPPREVVQPASSDAPTPPAPKKHDGLPRSTTLAQPVTLLPEAEGAVALAPSAHVAPAPAAAAQPDWQVLVSQADYEAARDAVERAGGFDAVLERAAADQLMTLQELARQVRQRPVALRALRRVIEKYPGDPLAPIAALTLAHLLEKAGDQAGAAAAYAEYRRLSPTGDFAEDALAKEFDAAFQRGDTEAALKLAEQHDANFPNGRRRAEIHAKLARMLGTAADHVDGGPADPESPDDEDDEQSSTAAPATSTK